jgi:AbrB family looped-hinge helix DNA binding protein
MPRMTSKGQVTIPKGVRDRLGIGPGSEIGFHEEGGQVVLRNEPPFADQKPHSAETPGQRMVRLMIEYGREARRKGIIDSAMTTDEYMELIRGPYDDVEPR